MMNIKKVLLQIIQPTFGEKMFGFPVTIDWSVTLILSLVVFTSTNLYAGLVWVCLYLSVLLHEFGHVYVAKLFNFKTHSIKMYIFGGIAHIEMDESDAKSQFYISIAGPLVNVVLYVLIISSYFIFPLDDLKEMLVEPSNFHVALMEFANLQILIILFNILPIYPLDGGRILRAIILGISKNLKTSNLAMSYISIFVSLLAIIFFSYFSLNIMALLIMFFIIYLNYSKISQIKKDDIRVKNLPKEILVLTRNRIIDFETRETAETLVGIYKPNPESPTIYMNIIDINRTLVFGERFDIYDPLNKTLNKLEEMGYKNDGATIFDDIVPHDIIIRTFKLN